MENEMYADGLKCDGILLWIAIFKGLAGKIYR